MYTVAPILLNIGRHGRVVMGDVVENPEIKSVALQYLIIHSQQPELLFSADDDAVAACGDREPFYDQFIADTISTLPHLSHEKLHDTTWRISQEDWLVVQGIFNDLSGLHNPWHHRYLGRVIPTVNDAISHLASTASGPLGVLKLVERYNGDFNNDQEVFLHNPRSIEDAVTATYEHFFKPSTVRAYPQMVTAAQGYFEGIDGLWGIPKFGETKLRAFQISVDDLLRNDFGYLGHLSVQNDTYVNGANIGEVVDPRNVFPTKSLKGEYDFDSIRPVKVTLEGGYRINDEVILPEGVVFGFPCNIYDVILPKVTGIERTKYFFLGLGRGLKAWSLNKLGLKSEESGYRVLQRLPSNVLLSQEMEATKRQAELRSKAEREAHEAIIKEKEAEANQAKAEVRAVRAEKVALEKEAELFELRAQYQKKERQLAEAYQQRIKARQLAHELRRYGNPLKHTQYLDLIGSLSELAKSDSPSILVGGYSIPQADLKSSNSMYSHLEALIDEENKDIPADIREKAWNLYRAFEVLKIGEGILLPSETKVEKTYFKLRPFIDGLIGNLRKVLEGDGKDPELITYSVDISEDLEVHADKESISAAFFNLLKNSAEEVYKQATPEPEIYIQAQPPEFGGTFHFEVYQKPSLPDKVIRGHQDPNKVKLESSKEDGHAEGHVIIYESLLQNNAAITGETLDLEMDGWGGLWDIALNGRKAA